MHLHFLWRITITHVCTTFNSAVVYLKILHVFRLRFVAFFYEFLSAALKVFNVDCTAKECLDEGIVAYCNWFGSASVGGDNLEVGVKLWKSFQWIIPQLKEFLPVFENSASWHFPASVRQFPQSICGAAGIEEALGSRHRRRGGACGSVGFISDSSGSSFFSPAFLEKKGCQFLFQYPFCNILHMLCCFLLLCIGRVTLK